MTVLQVWVKSATLRDGVITPGSSSFVVIDFFDYESQTTGLLTGSKPQWDFAATYKLVVDDFLLRYLATDVITLELNMASQGDFSMLARCGIPLSALLRSKPVVRLVNHPMLSVRSQVRRALPFRAPGGRQVPIRCSPHPRSLSGPSHPPPGRAGRRSSRT